MTLNELKLQIRHDAKWHMGGREKVVVTAWLYGKSDEYRETIVSYADFDKLGGHYIAMTMFPLNPYKNGELRNGGNL